MLSLPAILSALVLAGGLTALVLRWPAVRGTTLVAPWAWSIVSLVSIALTEIMLSLAGGTFDESPRTALRFVAAMSVFCPSMALLGAKRPQDRGWQFVVVALWGILALPGLEWLLFGGAQEVHPARWLFLGILVAGATLNGVATRYWPSSVLSGLGQLALVAPFFPGSPGWLGDSVGPLLGIALLSFAWALLAMSWPRGAAGQSARDRAWLDFRDAFGAVWGLRVLERMNASATMYDWPLKLTWQGFESRAASSESECSQEVIDEALAGLLRRFVSPEWIAVRLGAPSTLRAESLPAMR